MEILDIFGNSSGICRKMQDHQGLMTAFHLAGKTKLPGPKNKKILKKINKILRFVAQNLYGKLTFSQVFAKYFFEFWLLSESIYQWKNRSDF